MVRRARGVSWKRTLTCNGNGSVTMKAGRGGCSSTCKVLSGLCSESPEFLPLCYFPDVPGMYAARMGGSVRCVFFSVVLVACLIKYTQRHNEQRTYRVSVNYFFFCITVPGTVCSMIVLPLPGYHFQFLLVQCNTLFDSFLSLSFSFSSSSPSSFKLC